MTWLMIAAINIQSYDGISKKIISQASALAIDNKCCYLGCFIDDIPTIIGVSQNKKYSVIESNNNFNDNSTGSLKYIRQCQELPRFIKKSDLINQCQGFYVRHMLPNKQLIKLLSWLNIHNKKIVYEIPTYPYYYEQMSEAHSKIKTGARLVIESLYWPLIYNKVNRLTVIRCRTKSLHLKKMFDIKNGVACDLTSTNLKHSFSETYFNIIGIGTIYKYHGYDKMIEAIINARGIVRGKKIRFYIVGESDEISNLRKDVANCVYRECFIFCGKKLGEELEKLYSIADLAVGTLALNLRNADIDTAIKNIEYLSRKIPIVTSGKIFDINENSELYKIIEQKNPINISDLLDFSVEYYKIDRTIQINKILKRFSWSQIMASAIDEL